MLGLFRRKKQKFNSLKANKELAKFGLNGVVSDEHEEKSEVIVDHKKLKNIKGKYGGSEKKLFLEKLVECERLIKLCEKKGLYKVSDWDKNGVGMGSALSELLSASETYAVIRVEVETRSALAMKS